MLATIKHAIQRQTSAHGLMKRGQKPVKHEQFIGVFLGGLQPDSSKLQELQTVC